MESQLSSTESQDAISIKLGVEYQRVTGEIQLNVNHIINKAITGKPIENGRPEL